MCLTWDGAHSLKHFASYPSHARLKRVRRGIGSNMASLRSSVRALAALVLAVAVCAGHVPSRRSTSVPSQSTDDVPLWCGKPYTTVTLDRSDSKKGFSSAASEKDGAQDSLTVVAGRSPYTWEESGELVVRWASRAPVADGEFYVKARLVDAFGEASGPVVADAAAVVPGFRVGEFAVVPIDLSLIPMGAYTEIACDVFFASSGKAAADAPITVRLGRFPPKTNEVKVDARGMGLVVDNATFFPMGFYLEWLGSANFDAVMQTEINNGFNAPLPYRPGAVSDDYVAFMDALDNLGGRVHFDMYGLGMSPNSTSKTETITAYVNRLKDHPALLTYYVADEPDGDGKGLDPQVLIETYELIKSLDPYHPVIIVLNCFKNPYHAIAEYLPACDVMMTDPYCITVQQPVGCDLCEGDAFDVAVRADHYMPIVGGSKPFWMVLQAFGGGEHWLRQPTGREARAMTYLALVSGATGLLYFLEGIPHHALWSECGTLASEIASLAPALLAGPSRDPLETGVEIGLLSAGVRAQSFVDPADGSLVVVVVNAGKAPSLVSLRVSPALWSPTVEVEFEGRFVSLVGDTLQEPVEGLGTRVYRLRKRTEAKAPSPLPLLLNGDFEHYAEVGVPDGFGTANARPDRSHAHGGRFSMRMQCASGASPCASISSYPPKLYDNTTYSLTLWARGRGYGADDVVYVEVGGAGANATFAVASSTGEWQLLTLPAPITPPATAHYGVSVRLVTAGPVWVDDVSIEQL